MGVLTNNLIFDISSNYVCFMCLFVFNNFSSSSPIKDPSCLNIRSQYMYGNRAFPHTFHLLSIGTHSKRCMHTHCVVHNHTESHESEQWRQHSRDSINTQRAVKLKSVSNQTQRHMEHIVIETKQLLASLWVTADYNSWDALLITTSVSYVKWMLRYFL